MSKQTILVVDDEQDLLDLIAYNLNKMGYNVLTSDSGEQSIEIVRSVKPDLILLDIMMPGMNGIEVCRKIKEDKELQHIPVVFLTARGDENSEITGLDLGADDYLFKPISTSKLVSRIKAILRRFQPEQEKVTVLQVHDLLIDRGRYIVSNGTHEFRLPRKEFELLYFLASRQGKVLDRQTLLNEVWGSNVYVIDRTVDVHIRKIREKIGESYIETVKGVGYRFKE